MPTKQISDEEFLKELLVKTVQLMRGADAVVRNVGTHKKPFFEVVFDEDENYERSFDVIHLNTSKKGVKVRLRSDDEQIDQVVVLHGCETDGYSPNVRFLQLVFAYNEGESDTPWEAAKHAANEDLS